MPSDIAPLYLDEDVSVVVAAILRGRGFDAITTRDAGRLGYGDASQLVFAAHARRVLLTHNRADFERLHKEWLATGQLHVGMIIARRRLAVELAARIGRLLMRLPASALEDQLLYV
jgi:hypothetical protein